MKSGPQPKALWKLGSDVLSDEIVVAGESDEVVVLEVSTWDGLQLPSKSPLSQLEIDSNIGFFSFSLVPARMPPEPDFEKGAPLNGAPAFW